MTRRVFDPLLILSQIGFLQSIHHVLLILGCVLLVPLDSDALSVSNALAISNPYQWMPLLTSPILAAVVAKIVQEPKKCLDFVATIYILHTVIGWIYIGVLQGQVSWWIAHFLALAVTTVISEIISIRYQQKHALSLSQ
jgi:hypothetical protein